MKILLIIVLLILFLVWCNIPKPAKQDIKIQVGGVDTVTIWKKPDTRCYK